MTLELVSLMSSDKLGLPGLLYQPDKPTAKVAIWLHGMGDSGIFYNPARLNALGKALTEQGIALLAFNNRGAHNSKSLRIMDDSLAEDKRSYPGGTHYELIADCVHDIDGAVTYAKDRGFSEFYLLGHSTGANKICAYQARAPKSPFSKYVLAGPGDDIGLFFNELGAARFKQAREYARHTTLSGTPLKIMPRYTGMYPFSAQAADDILDPDGAYNTFPFYEATTERLGSKPFFQEYTRLDRPTLVIFGAEDEAAYTGGGATKALDLFMRHTSNQHLKQTDFMLVEAADHSFHGQELEFANKVANWLGQTK